MRHGLNRRAYQTLPESEERIVCVGIPGDRQDNEDWWSESIMLWGEALPSALRGSRKKNYLFVLVAPLASVRNFWAANDGLTGWMYVSSTSPYCGYLIPDRCRQEGGCPEVWHVNHIKGKGKDGSRTSER